jgi:hypothetical protein
MGEMRVLVGCEKSGIVRDAFRLLGHHAVSCDIEPSDRPGPHHQGDLIEYMEHCKEYGHKWDLVIAFPPCTYLAYSGLHWNKTRPDRAKKTEEALDFVRNIISHCEGHTPLCIENPNSLISAEIKPATQQIHPYMFGEKKCKRTMLYLWSLPKLVSTCDMKAETYALPKEKRHWITAMGPSKDRGAKRSVFFEGIAEAMANQWGGDAREV